jgi:hypothetical protein
VILEQSSGLGDLLLPSHEAGELEGEVVGSDVQRLQWWEVGGEPLHDQVEEVFRVSDVLQTMLSEVPDGDAVGQIVLHQTSGGI